MVIIIGGNDCGRFIHFYGHFEENFSEHFPNVRPNSFIEAQKNDWRKT